MTRLASRTITTLLFLVTATVAMRADEPARGAGDLLDEAQKREQIAIQKAESEFRTALVELHKVAAADPARGAERLKSMLAVLEEDTVLPAAKRDAWKRMLKDRIRGLQEEAVSKAKEDIDRAERTAKLEEQRDAAVRLASEDEKFKDGLKSIERLQKEGKYADAARAADEMAKRNPNSPSAAALSRITSTNNSLRELHDIREQRSQKTVASWNDVEKSLMPDERDISFPKNWRELTARRKQPQPTKAEQAILRALDTPVKVNFRGETFESVINYLQTLTGQTIRVDKETLDAAGIGYDTPVTTNFPAGGTSLRTVLRVILAEKKLAYIVRNETIEVLTKEQAASTLTTRTYSLGDIAVLSGLNINTLGGRAQMYQTVALLMQNIIDMDPDSWAVTGNGGKGKIIYEPASMTLIVTQTAEVHYKLGGSGLGR
jgi:hypothetical protein